MEDRQIENWRGECRKNGEGKRKREKERQGKRRGGGEDERQGKSNALTFEFCRKKEGKCTGNLKQIISVLTCWYKRKFVQ